MISQSLDFASLAINDALASDPANQRFIAALGKLCILVESANPSTRLYIYLDQGEVALSDQLSGAEADGETHPDLVIRGTALNLTKLLFSNIQNSAALRQANIQVEGDAALLLELTQLAQTIEIDWQALLADRIGETPAVIASRGFETARKASTEIFTQQWSVFEAWLKQPNSPLPTREEYEQMKTSLRDLQYRIDRLGANLSNLQRQTSERTK